MAEEDIEVTGNQEPHGEPEPDYKAMYEKALAESRKWEGRSKANAEKARKFDEMETAKRTLEERVSAIEARNKALESEKARAALVKDVAESTGVPEAIVSNLSATDKETMTAQAEAIAAAYKTPGGAPKAPEAGKFPKEKDVARISESQFVKQLFSQD